MKSETGLIPVSSVHKRVHLCIQKPRDGCVRERERWNGPSYAYKALWADIWASPALFLETALPTAKSQLKPAFNKYTVETGEQWGRGRKTNGHFERSPDLSEVKYRFKPAHCYHTQSMFQKTKHESCVPFDIVTCLDINRFTGYGCSISVLTVGPPAGVDPWFKTHSHLMDFVFLDYWEQESDNQTRDTLKVSGGPQIRDLWDLSRVLTWGLHLHDGTSSGQRFKACSSPHEPNTDTLPVFVGLGYQRYVVDVS